MEIKFQYVHIRDILIWILLKKIFTFADVEDTTQTSIEQSLLQSGAAISLYSTVLNQALCNSIPIIIDNMSNPENFNKLKELGYVCLL